MSLVELVKPDKVKPARLLRKPETNELILEYTGVDGNVYRVPVAIALLPQEFGELAAQLGFADLVQAIRVSIVDSKIALPTDVQYRRKESLTLFTGTVTASGATVDIDVSNFSAMELEIKVTAVSGTTPSLSVYIEGKFTATEDYKPLVYVENIGSTGIWYLTITQLVFKTIRVRWVVSGTSPSFTFTVAAEAVV